MKFLSQLTEIVGTKVSDMLSKRKALIFDGWSSYTIHCVAAYAYFQSTNTDRYDTRLLTSISMGD